MITLKTLNNYSEQEVFDHVAEHLLAQMCRAESEDGDCRYRGEGGLKCAAGCLIGDDEYSEDIEERDWITLVTKKQVPPDHQDLIMRLQDLHDSNEPNIWKRRLALLAQDFQLNALALI